jgi:hypothetical protein
MRNTPQGPSGGIAQRPARQRLRDRVHEGDPGLLVGGDDRVTDARQRGDVAALALAELPLGGMLVERHLDGGPQLGILEGLQQIAERLRQAGPPQGVVIGIGCQEYDRNTAILADLLGCIDAVEGTLEPDVHEHQVRLGISRERESVLPARGGGHHHMTDAAQLLLDVPGHHAIVFDDEDPGRCHRAASASPSATKAMAKRVPLPRSTAMVPCS